MEPPHTKRHILDLPEMDAQHTYLYTLYDLIEDSIAVTNQAVMRSILKEIERYLLFHFQSEEFLMRSYAFAGFAVHQSDHEAAGTKLVQFLDDFDAGKLNPAALKIFLTGWLMEHSKTADEDYSRYIKQMRALTGSVK